MFFLNNRDVFMVFFSFIIIFYSFDKFFKSSQWEDLKMFFNNYKEEKKNFFFINIFYKYFLHNIRHEFTKPQKIIKK